MQKLVVQILKLTNRIGIKINVSLLFTGSSNVDDQFLLKSSSVTLPLLAGLEELKFSLKHSSSAA